MSILDLPRHDFTNSATELTANELSANEMAASELAASELATSELAVNELAANELTANEIASNEISHSDVTQNDTVPDFGQNHPELHSDVMHADSYEPCISTQNQISYIDQSNMQAITTGGDNVRAAHGIATLVKPESPPDTVRHATEDCYHGSVGQEMSQDHYGDDEPLNEQIYQRCQSNDSKENSGGTILSRQNSESSLCALPPISWTSTSKSEYDSYKKSKHDGRPGSVQPKLYAEPRLDWRSKMDAHFTKKFGTVRTTIIHYGAGQNGQGPSTHTHSQNLPLTRSVSVPNTRHCHDNDGSFIHRELTYPVFEQCEPNANFADDAASGQNDDDHRNLFENGNSVIYYHHAQTNQECESTDIHYTNTYSVAANQNHLFQSGPETMICYTTLPAMKSNNQKPDVVANQIMAHQIQIACNSVASRCSQNADNSLDLNITSNHTDVPIAPRPSEVTVDVIPSGDTSDQYHGSKKEVPVTPIEYEHEVDQESGRLRICKGQKSILDRSRSGKRHNLCGAQSNLVVCIVVQLVL